MSSSFQALWRLSCSAVDNPWTRQKHDEKELLIKAFIIAEIEEEQFLRVLELWDLPVKSAG